MSGPTTERAGSFDSDARIAGTQIEAWERDSRQGITAYVDLRTIVGRVIPEVRRLRSLVRRAAVPNGQTQPLCPSDRDDDCCWWCGVSLIKETRPVLHAKECPWPEIEAEALAQREDEKR